MYVQSCKGKGHALFMYQFIILTLVLSLYLFQERIGETASFCSLVEPGCTAGGTETATSSSTSKIITVVKNYLHLCDCLACCIMPLSF